MDKVLSSGIYRDLLKSGYHVSIFDSLSYKIPIILVAYPQVQMHVEVQVSVSDPTLSRRKTDTDQPYQWCKFLYQSSQCDIILNEKKLEPCLYLPISACIDFPKIRINRIGNTGVSHLYL